LAYSFHEVKPEQLIHHPVLQREDSKVAGQLGLLAIETKQSQRQAVVKFVADLVSLPMKELRHV